MGLLRMFAEIGSSTLVSRYVMFAWAPKCRRKLGTNPQSKKGKACASTPLILARLAFVGAVRTRKPVVASPTVVVLCWMNPLISRRNAAIDAKPVGEK